MEDKPIIDEEKRKNLEKLLQGSLEDVALAISIVDQCDIEQSFPELLIVASAYPSMAHTMNTVLIESKTFSSYVLHLLNGNQHLIPVENDLNFLIELWERHQKLHIMSEDLKFRKKLATAYTRNSFEPFISPQKLRGTDRPKTIADSFKDPGQMNTRSKVASKNVFKKDN